MDNAFSFYTTVFGLTVGMMPIFGGILAFCQSHLPSRMIKELVGLLEETQDLYDSAVEAGLLPDSTLRRQMKDTLAKLRKNMQSLRVKAHSATTLLEDYQGFFKGLSYSIAVICCQVKELRASIIRLPNSAELVSAQTIAPSGSHHRQHCIKYAVRKDLFPLHNSTFRFTRMHDAPQRCCASCAILPT
ncbi:hypothetical protein K503DRAFT_369726 [Rhizopogon vinicolor AM-OR11-026]|uniref:Uncharacterized protein n=1 Tax=Rhizopogon vinicolor AM-OR11-026 TaxID=1314800 RepID=A0A1B7NBW6_9AGAM|nr:hypothetical protein K503DRAFT_369726 [Rhizopogon vinicolor AM-OR11-026]